MQLRVLFGAGSGAENFLQNSPNEQFDFVLDSDTAKMGTVFQNGISISHPNEVNLLSVSEFVVATQEAASVVQFLRGQGVPVGRIRVAPKALINRMPFRERQIREAAGNWMQGLANQFEECGVRALVHHGTALGAHRDGDIIPWDSDLNVQINSQAMPLTGASELICSFKGPNGHETAVVEKQTKDVLRLRVLTAETWFVAHVEAWSLDAPTVERRIPSNTVTFPSSWFARGESILWRYGEIFVPSPIEDYLHHLYGKEWRIPNEAFTVLDYR